jgi:DNA-binding transcriptional MerR regulator/methylmalonyl-CoA mutase cobalamin-binding subunit
VDGGSMKAPREAEHLYQIRAVSKLTGIGIDTLRAWERRYGAVTPRRDGRGRAYTEGDVARLRLLQEAAAAGHSIGRIARLDDAALRRLTAQQPARAPASAVDHSRLNAALLALDTSAIDQECARLAATLSPLGLVRDVLLPALREVGDAWNERPGGIAREHVISGTVRHLLGTFLRIYARRGSPVRLLFATPAGERHEIGILSAAMLAATQGMGISYVGPDLPASEIVEAVKAADAHVLVLGLTRARTRQESARELAAIARGIPAEVEIWVGGPAATHHAPSFASRALVLADFDAYEKQLARLIAGA